MDNTLGLTEKELIEVRKNKLKEIEALGLNPYTSKSCKNITAAEIHEKEDSLIESEKKVIAAGRIMAMRGHGKLSFVDLSDQSGKIQAVLRADILDDNFKLVSFLDLGDFIEVEGKVFKTKAGETSVEAHSVRILTKSLKPLPDLYHGLTDEETRLRKRYLEFAINPELRELFIKKSKFWQSTREFLSKKGFLEVETPVLENTAGGADANPFVTHHNSLDIDVFLRISMGELWQKRLMVGGFDKTFEIGRQFRNEGMSREHLQDYSQMEFYWGYANYEDSMELVKEMYRYIAKETFGTTKFKMGNFDVDLADEWKKIDYVDAIKDKHGIDVLESSEDQIKEKLQENKIRYEKNDKKGRLIDLLWKNVRKDIAGPAFLVNHPVEVSPLAKRKEGEEGKVERYQVILNGSENGNGYSELNDPVDQESRFAEQAKLREDGDTEAQMHDEDFVEALMYGMPPTSGFGFSERLFSTFADKSIRECVMFPLLRPDQSRAVSNK